MFVKNNPATMPLILFVVSLSVSGAMKEKHVKREEISATGPAVMWREPADIKSRDLFYGPGGRSHVPHGRVTFVKEDLDGTNLKLVVTDQDGQKWKVKLGLEARPETTATRLVWAVGYYTNEDYFVPELQVRGLPEKLQRGQELIGPNGFLRNVRLKRESKEEKKIGNWHWRHDAFTGTRELNGLKVMMALILDICPHLVGSTLPSPDPTIGGSTRAISMCHGHFGPSSCSTRREKRRRNPTPPSGSPAQAIPLKERAEAVRP